MEQFSIPFVLMVDDDEDDRTLFAEIFAKSAPNTRLQLAKNGLDMQKLLREQPLPEIIFLDLNMPCMNGFDCLNFIRSNAHTRHIPVIIYTTSASAVDIEQAYHMGATYYLAKPSNLTHLENAIRYLLPQNLKEHEASMSDFVLDYR